MTEDRATRIKRLNMRSMRRGIKEMDLILMASARTHLPNLSDADLETYDAPLSDNDPDIYSWIVGTGEAPERYAAIFPDIRAGAEGLTRPV